uniref:StmU n=1 Tax=Streptomyces seoulensis TaxID=73044 RepID=A0A2S1P8N1_STRSO|nr:StmU [Streptomyces seoulensis]
MFIWNIATVKCAQLECERPFPPSRRFARDVFADGSEGAAGTGRPRGCGAGRLSPSRRGCPHDRSRAIRPWARSAEGLAGTFGRHRRLTRPGARRAPPHRVLRPAPHLPHVRKFHSRQAPGGRKLWFCMAHCIGQEHGGHRTAVGKHAGSRSKGGRTNSRTTGTHCPQRGNGIGPGTAFRTPRLRRPGAGLRFSRASPPRLPRRPGPGAACCPGRGRGGRLSGRQCRPAARQRGNGAPSRRPTHGGTAE